VNERNVGFALEHKVGGGKLIPALLQERMLGSELWIPLPQIVAESPIGWIVNGHLLGEM